jgi:hypothetical protein
MQNIKG